MQDYPHQYIATATASPADVVRLDADGLATLVSNAPRQFGGPGDEWSPEDLLVASVASCFVLTFRAISRGSRFNWDRLSCSVNGVLDRVDGVTRFTQFHIKATLHTQADSDEHKAMRLLEKSEAVCLVTNSLNAVTLLDAQVVVGV